MEFELLGRPGEGVALDLDHREFSYAGKFVMGDSGKVVVREDNEVIAAASFSPDRTDETTARIRYITVRNDRRGEGIGSKLLATLRKRLISGAYERATIAVNNPFAYQAAYRAGFAWSGEETGLAELVLCSDIRRDPRRYQAGLERFAERDDISDGERHFIVNRAASEPPDVVEPPTGWVID